MSVSKPKSPVQLDIPISNSDLIRKRGTVKGRLTCFARYVAALQSPLSTLKRAELKLRIQAAASILADFNAIQCGIEELASEDELVGHLEHRECFESSYFETIAHASSIAALDEPGDGSTSSLRANGEGARSVKLPTISLPTFDGSFENWLEFRDTYISLIHTCRDIGDVDKLHYLRSALTGSALEVVSSLQASAYNYPIAWQLLEDRYNNNRLLVNNHVRALFNIQAVNSESSYQIRRLIDNVAKRLRCLEVLGEPVRHWDTLVMFMITSKLDPATEREWEQHKGTLISKSNESTKLKLSDLTTYLSNRADMLDAIKSTHSRSNNEFKKQYTNSMNNNKSNSNNYANTNNNKLNNSLNKINVYSATQVTDRITRRYSQSKQSSANARKCPLCYERHFLHECKSFSKQSVRDRITFVREKQLCLNCMRPGHAVPECALGVCKICGDKHNTALHIAEDSDAPNETVVSANALTTREVKRPYIPSDRCAMTAGESGACAVPAQVVDVLLCTARVLIPGADGTMHAARALLDNGSQYSFITKDLADKIQIPKIQSTNNIIGVGESVTQSHEMCKVRLHSNCNTFNFGLQCIILTKITSALPSRRMSADVKLPCYVRLADPGYNVPSEVDLLIGAESYWELMNNERIRSADGPFLQSTKLGWVISGPLFNVQGSPRACIASNSAISLDKQVRLFWEFEEIDVPRAISDDERACEELFMNTVRREDGGRFSVRMPLKQSADALGNTYALAESRFLSLERKFARNPEFKKLYSEFINEYIRLGHMSRVNAYGSPHFFLPHHGVMKDSTTTQLRVVFDASAASSSGISLNDIQIVGPRLQSDLFSILLRFRQHRFVACADVEKMYRQVLVQPDQRDLQLIIWRENSSDRLNVYQLNTVTYGQAASAYLSVRCLMQLAEECANESIARVIREDFYVDDLLTGAQNKDELLRICTAVSSALDAGCFPLRKWVSNTDVVGHISSTAASRQMALGENVHCKTLGLGWHNGSDRFDFSSEIGCMLRVTKRSILSAASQIFDPLGLLSPLVITPKILLQRLWLCKVGWDDIVPDDVATAWQNFSNGLSTLRDITVPRYVLGECTDRVELHIFSDASQSAYGACAYVRTCAASSGECTVRLLCAKGKVAPLKPVSIPRLELCGALVGARLYKKIVSCLRLTFNSILFWTDSTIVLGWLRMPPNQLKTFVQNRVTEINELTGALPWSHVRGAENPADLLSRGVTLEVLRTSELWWHGPAFLTNADITSQPSDYLRCSANDLPEITREF